MSSGSRLTTTATSTSLVPAWLGLYVLLLAGFVTIFDLFVVNVAIPSMQTSLDASFAQIGYIVAGYELAFGVLLITGGRLGDLLGRRRLFVVGMAGFTVASGLCGLAPTAGFLIAARVLQGLAAALLFPQVYASIRVNFSGEDSRRAFGLLGMTLGLAAIAGQVLGGWLVHANLFGLGWRTIFLVNVPVGLFAMVAARFIPESRASQPPALDWQGVGLVSSALALLLVPLIEGPGHGWPAWTLWCVVAAMVLFAVFYRHEERQRRAGHQPLVDMRLLSLTHAIETYILAKDGNRPHLMRRAFAADAELVMNVKTDEISFPSRVKGLDGVSATLVSQFVQRYENIYTFCLGPPPGNVATFRCGWLVCMSEKGTGAVRIGFGEYEWICREDAGLISKLTITIEEMKTLPSQLGHSIFQWANRLSYPWCSNDVLLRSTPDIPAVQEMVRLLGRCR